MSDAVLDKARELGRVLTQSPEYRDVKAKQKVMFNDNAALEMLKTFHLMQDAAQKKQAKGEALSRKELRALEEMELKMAAHPAISAFHESQRNYQNLINKVLETVIRVQKEEQEQALIKEQIPGYEPGKEYVPEPDPEEEDE